jgi:hypothetical protein
VVAVKHVDEVRGFERTIFFESAGGHKTSGGVPLTNCVIEVVENDAQGNCPMLSLRFFHKPVYDAKTARELAESGHPV